MKIFLFLALSIPLLSLSIFAQTATPSPTITQLSPSPTPSPVAARNAPPDLPYMVEILASSVMLGSVLAVFVLVRRLQERSGLSISPRHIQFVSVCLIVPTILILGLEQVLSKETTATLIGGLTGYLLSGLGRYEPPRGGGGDDDKSPTPPDSTSGGNPNENRTGKTEATVVPSPVATATGDSATYGGEYGGMKPLGR